MLTLSTDNSGLNRGIDDAQSRAVNALNETGDQMVETGSMLTKRVTAPIVGLAGAAIAVGLGFDDQMARVRAATGATEEGFQSLRGTAQELGSTTRFSATEAAQGMEFLAFAGFEVNEVMEAMPGMLDLASVAGGDLATTADIVSDTMMAFGMEASEAGDAADIFAQQFSQSNTSVLQLGEAMKMVAPQAKAAGMELGETSAVLGVLADAGLKGSMAGTTVNAMLRDLIGNAEDGAVAIGDTSVAVFDAEGNFRDFGDIMRDVDSATEGMNDSQREAALRNIFQAQSIRGVNLMLDEGIDNYDEYAAANENAAGKAGEMAGVMEDTLGGAFRELKSQTEGILIQLSDHLAPIMREQVVPAIQRAGEIVSDLIERFGELSPRTQKIILGAIALVAALGPVLVVLGMVAGAMANLVGPVMGVIKVLGLMGKAVILLGKVALANPIILVIAAIIVAAMLLWKHWDEVVAAVSKAWDWISGKAEDLRDWVVDTVTDLRDRASAAWQDMRDRVVARVEELRAGAVRKFQSLVSWVTGLPGRIWSALSSLASKMSERARTALSDFRQAMVDRALDAVAWVKGLPGRLLSALGNVGSILLDAGRQIIQGLWDGLKERWSGAVSWIGGLGDEIRERKGPLREDRRMLADEGHAIIRGLHENMRDEWGDVASWLDGLSPQIAASISAEPADGGESGGGGEFHLHMDRDGRDADALFDEFSWKMATARMGDV